MDKYFIPMPKTPRIKKEPKSINKVSKNKESVTKETYDAVFNRDKGVCRFEKCKNKDIQLHHINGRSKLLTNNIDNCIILCNEHHILVGNNNKKYRKILNKLIKKGENK